MYRFKYIPVRNWWIRSTDNFQNKILHASSLYRKKYSLQRMRIERL